MYKTLQKINWPALEEEMLDFWNEQNIFEKSIANKEKDFVFFEGPPSANGMPGIHHVMARAIKDIFCRYKTLKGFKVERKGGWDTHGLPVELQVEKRLGIKKEDIGVKISVDEYNQECRKDVMKFKAEWDRLTERIGYWVDLENPYVTYENEYIETLWHLLKRLYDKGFLYKGYTIQPYSPAAGTGLSTHELNQPGTYRDVKDTSCTALFRLKDRIKGYENEEVHLLAWTTTPWTLPSNTALAVGKKIDYQLIETANPYNGGKILVIIAKDLMHKYFKEEGENKDILEYVPKDKVLPWKNIADLNASDLIGLNYEQLLPYSQPKEGEAFKVISGNFVTTEDGTGIVHIAPSFGADDQFVAKENGIGSLTLVDERGRFTKDVKDKQFPLEGIYVKSEYLSENEKEAELKIQQEALRNIIPNLKNYLSADELITLKLKLEGKAFKIEKYNHSYPHCWRTDKPILYYPLDSWFVKTTAVKDKLVALNKTINWKPKSTGEGRFGNWLENLQDWNLSRSRYWGTPLPIWRTEDGKEELCIGSIDELKKEVSKANTALSLNQVINDENIDLHKPFVDSLTLVSSSGKAMKRESDLIDVWFDSGAMPYAQWGIHQQDKWKKYFPADYIAEGVDQTRGWFFTLHAISTMLFDSVAYKNVIANGLVLDKKGNKMSKRLNNAIDPFKTIDTYGADAVRWYMFTNSSPWDNLKFDLEGVAEVQRKFFGTLSNTYAFFALYANVDGYHYSKENALPLEDRSELDRWIISKLNSLIKEVESSMEDYDPTPACRAIHNFVTDHVSNWFVRLSRRRFWKSQSSSDKKAAYDTLYECLLTISQLMSSAAPFYSDWLYQSLLQNKQSVHCSSFPEVIESSIDKDLEESMNIAQQTCSLLLSIRKKENIKVRQPLQKAMIPVLNDDFERHLKHAEALIKAEVNIKDLQYLSADNNTIVKGIKPNFKVLGARLGKEMKNMAAAINQFSKDQINELENEGKIAVSLGDQAYELNINEVVIEPKDIPGWSVASEGSITVALDKTITPELEKEGIAREFVNRLQNMRKDQGLDVTDRISVKMMAPEAIKTAINAFNDYICAEILAESIDMLEQLEQTGTEIEINDHKIEISIHKN
jgi:isoleucyl-tRNA synthetase